MSNTFTELNDLSRSADGVFRFGEAAEFNYSDGEDSELKLREILETAQDLSSNSAELEQQIIDWPTEYHLSSARANLLRGLQLDGVKTVLELGCGCGSISRYLGEQKGLEVDSIEGSATRASLAALRCSDLPNVTISNGNFNEMKFPQDYYDLVLFVGVTEYAGRFSERETDQEALQDLLALAKSAIKSDGVVLVAIENRLGLKYIMGANEDHYGVPNIGLDDYPNSTGIRTYSKHEWLSQIEQAGFTASHFAYPLPDYKVPSCVISQQCEPNNPQLGKAFETIKSRDYLVDFDLGEREAVLWKAITAAGVLGELANSYTIMLGYDSTRLKNMLDFDLLSYQPIEHTYLADVKVASQQKAHKAKHNVAQQVHIDNITHELDLLKRHAQELEGELELIKHSRAWRFTRKIRSVFGNSNR